MKIQIIKYNENSLSKWDDFVMKKSLNGTIYHTMNFLSYHKNKFEDCSIMIYDKNITNLIAVFPCCKVNNEYYSHRGSTCGGIVILEKYYKLTKLTEIMDNIYNYYKGNLHLKLSETIYFKNNIKNDLLNFVLSQKCKKYQDISLYFDIVKNDNIIDNFPKSRNKTFIKKHINNPDPDITFTISDNINDYKKYFNILETSLSNKNNVKPLHTLEEFLLLKNLLRDKQFLFISKNKENEILSGAWILKINDNGYYAPYLTTNYGKKKSELFYSLFELFKFAKKNNIKYVNLGACSTGGGKVILESLYKFKSSCGCEPVLKYSFSYTNKLKDNLIL